MCLSKKQLIVLVTLAIVNSNQVYSLETGENISTSIQSTNHQFFISIYDLLHDAIGEDNPLEVEMFIEFGADINYRYENGKTPLMIASSMGSKLAVKTLLTLGANSKLRSKHDMTALDYANQINNELIIRLLNHSDIIIAEDIPDNP